MSVNMWMFYTVLLLWLNTLIMKQKKSLLFGALSCLTTFFLLSCGSRVQSNDTANKQDSLNAVESEVWYGEVFPSSSDIICKIPDNICSTDWMQLYIQYIEKNFNEEDGIWTMNKGEESFDCRYWSIANVDNDTIPELLLYGGCLASGSIILTQYNGKVYVSPKGGFMFIDGANGLIHSQGAHSDETWGAVYEMDKGLFVEKCSYYCFTNYYDTNEVGKYGLDKENINNWLMDDGTVGISGIILNGKLVDASYGIRNWSYDELKITMDSLYYSKGRSIHFPKPVFSEAVSIDELVK